MATGPGGPSENPSDMPSALKQSGQKGQICDSVLPAKWLSSKFGAERGIPGYFAESKSLMVESNTV